MALTELIYVSSMIGEKESALAAILESSVRRNTQDGITGMLLYYRGGFMQVLEGEAEAVATTFARICRDPRHHNIVTLSQATIAQRSFGTWSMGFKQVNPRDLEQFPQHAAYFNFGQQAHAIQGRPGLALEMLRLFSRDMV